jgi:ribosomal protein S18 acetylase RimI-like enzyme
MGVFMVVSDSDLVRVGGPAAGDWLAVVAAIYAEVYAEPLFARHAFFHPADFGPRYLRNVAQVGFELLVAHRHGVPIGCLYGSPLQPGTSWWDGVRWYAAAQGEVGPGFCNEDGNRTVVITQLMVRTDARRSGVGCHLHDAFLAGRSERRAALRVLPDNEPAKSAYRDWGWRPLGLLRPAEAAPVFECQLKILTS